MDSKAGYLLRHYKLTEGDCTASVSDKHLGEISCKNWRLLPPYLTLTTSETTEVVVSDLERDYKTEEERRTGFFRKWKMRKGFEATYIALINALLEINCREDAEGVCKLVLAGTTPDVFPNTTHVLHLPDPKLSSSMQLPGNTIPISKVSHLPRISPSEVAHLPESSKSSSKTHGKYLL